VPAPPNGGTVQIGDRFVLDLMINGGSNGDMTAQQSYMSFNQAVTGNGRVSSLGTSCTLTNTVTGDTCGLPGCGPTDGTGFDAILQNEICTVNVPCVFRGVPVPPGSFAFASGALNNGPQGGVFRVAQIGLCALAAGTSTFTWQFSGGPCDTGAPITRDTEIVVSTGDLVQDCTQFVNYTINVAGAATNTPTSTNTAVPTNTFTHTAVPTNTNTPIPTNTFTNTPVPTDTNTATVTPIPTCPGASHYFVPHAGSPANGGTIVVGDRFTLDMLIHTNNIPNLTGQQAYLTFPNNMLQNVNATLSGCTLASTVTGDFTVFDAELQNEACNGPGPCSFGGAGTISFANGALSNSPYTGPDFRVAQVAMCATAPGTATLHWEFFPFAPATRDTEIVDDNSVVVNNRLCYVDYVVNIVAGTATATNTPVNTATHTHTPTNTPTNTATATNSPTNTPVNTNTNTNTPTHTRTSTSTPTNSPVATFTPTAFPTCDAGSDYRSTVTGAAAMDPGTTLVPGSQADDTTSVIVLPFTYSLYGIPFNSVRASTNGNLQFVSNNTAFSNVCLPTNTLNYAILPYWDDLNLSSTISTSFGIYTSLNGSVGNRVFNIEWKGVLFGSSNLVDFEVQLFEFSDPSLGQAFDYVYLNGPVANGSSATIGVQRATGVSFTQFSCNTASISSGTRIHWLPFPCNQPTPTSTATATVTNTPAPTDTATPLPTCGPNSQYVVTQGTGTAMGGATRVDGTGCDDCMTNIPIPFTFYLYGTAYNAVKADSNGNLQLGSNNSIFANSCLPSGSLNDAILSHWDDLRTDCATCGIFTSVSGPVGSRIFVIQWKAIFFSGPGNLDFEVRLYEPVLTGDSAFDIFYTTVDNGGASATIGVQRGSGPQNTQFSCNTAGLTAGELLHFAQVPCVTATPTATDTAIPTNTHTPTSTHTPVDTATPTDTPVNTDTPTRTATNTFTRTPTHTPTDTPTSTDTPTETPVNTDTPTETPTNTFTATRTRTRTNTPTITLTRTRTSTPTITRTITRTTVPTFTAVRTNTPSVTRTRTASPTITNTPVPGTCTRCHLNINRMTISCNPDGTVHWTAEVHNEDRCSRTENWTAKLQIKRMENDDDDDSPNSGDHESNWYTVATQHGTIFLPGKDKNTASGDFCFQFPPNATKMRVSFKIDSSEEHCHPQKKSPERTPCNRTAPCPPAFPDVPADSTFYTEIMGLSAAGVVSGYGDGNFKVDSPTYRGQIAKMVVLAFGISVQTTLGGHFSDVPADHPYYAYIEAAYARGLVDGYGDGTFRPYNNVTRGQVAKIVVQAAGLALVTPATPSFSDVAQSSTFYNYIETARSAGILNGYPDGTFRPDKPATRGQISKITFLAAYTPEE
jgi:hypothetical protein